MNEKMIFPLVGFGPVRFGMTMEEVVKLIGEPCAVLKDELETLTGIEKSVDHEYTYRGLELSYGSDDNYRLGSITFNTADFLLKGRSLVGLPEEALLTTLRKMGVNDAELDDEIQDLKAKDYYSESLNMSYWLLDGFVDSISIFPEYSEDGESICWPS